MTINKVNNERLRKNREFRNVMQNGVSHGTRNLVLYILANNLNMNRAGFVASKKVGNSVVRNRIKRLLKESYRFYGSNIKTGNDLVFIARLPFARLNYKQAVAEMRYILQRGGLFIIKSK